MKVVGDSIQLKMKENLDEKKTWPLAPWYSGNTTTLASLGALQPVNHATAWKAMAVLMTPATQRSERRNLRGLGLLGGKLPAQNTSLPFVKLEMDTKWCKSRTTWPRIPRNFRQESLIHLAQSIPTLPASPASDSDAEQNGPHHGILDASRKALLGLKHAHACAFANFQRNWRNIHIAEELPKKLPHPSGNCPNQHSQAHISRLISLMQTYRN